MDCAVYAHELVAGEAALTEEAERLFKVVAPGRDRDACETNRLHRIIKASKEMVERSPAN